MSLVVTNIITAWHDKL